MATKVYISLTKVFLESRGLRKCHECVILTWWRRVSCPKCRSPRSRESILVSAVRIVKVLLSKMKKVWMLKSLMESLLYEPILPTIYIWSMREDLSESRQDKSCEDVSSKLGGRETQAEVGHCHNRPEETHRNLMKLIIIDHNQHQHIMIIPTWAAPLLLHIFERKARPRPGIRIRFKRFTSYEVIFKGFFF